MHSVTDIGRRLYVQPGRREEFLRIMDEHDTITGFESQIFRKDGSFVKEFAYEKNTRASGSVLDLDFWIDGKQTFLFNADGTNNEVRTLVRESGEVVGAFGRNGRNAGEFHWVHNLAIDSKGNLYTTEVDTGKRAQKFRYVGPAVAK